MISTSSVVGRNSFWAPIKYCPPGSKFNQKLISRQYSQVYNISVQKQQQQQPPIREYHNSIQKCNPNLAGKRCMNYNHKKCSIKSQSMDNLCPEFPDVITSSDNDDSIVFLRSKVSDFACLCDNRAPNPRKPSMPGKCFRNSKVCGFNNIAKL